MGQRNVGKISRVECATSQSEESRGSVGEQGQVFERQRRILCTQQKQVVELTAQIVTNQLGVLNVQGEIVVLETKERCQSMRFGRVRSLHATRCDHGRGSGGGADDPSKRRRVHFFLQTSSHRIKFLESSSLFTLGRLREKKAQLSGHKR